MKNIIVWCATGTCVALLGLASTEASADSARRFTRPNAAGGTTAGAVTRHVGPNGGATTSRRVLRTDGEGNGMATSGRAWQTPNGGTGGRAGVTTHSADGSVQHKSGFATSSAKGSVNSQGSLQRDADGNVTQNRTTNATNATTGNSYQGSTSYDSTTGLSHSGSCFDAGGNAIACPRR